MVLTRLLATPKMHIFARVWRVGVQLSLGVSHVEKRILQMHCPLRDCNGGFALRTRTSVGAREMHCTLVLNIYSTDREHIHHTCEHTYFLQHTYLQHTNVQARANSARGLMCMYFLPDPLVVESLVSLSSSALPIGWRIAEIDEMHRTPPGVQLDGVLCC